MECAATGAGAYAAGKHKGNKDNKDNHSENEAQDKDEKNKEKNGSKKKALL